MTGFTASNDMTVERDHNGDMVIDRGAGSTSVFMGDGTALALREFFQHERDEELGRWRSQKYPGYVVHLKGDGLLIAVNEKSGRNLEVARASTREIKGHAPILWRVIAEYVEAHPERKPWEDAKPGDVWVISVDGEESFVVHAHAELFGAVVFKGVTGRLVNMNSSAHTGARKIWPEDAS